MEDSSDVVVDNVASDRRQSRTSSCRCAFQCGEGLSCRCASQLKPGSAYHDHHIRERFGENICTKEVSDINWARAKIETY